MGHPWGKPKLAPWPRTPEQKEHRRARMQRYMQTKRAADPGQAERERSYRSRPEVRAALTAASTEFKRDRRQRLNDIKMEAGCHDCGFAGHPAALQFDHVRGVKVFEVGSQVSAAWDRIKAEIAKCDVVCANCHAIRTATRRAEQAGTNGL